MLPYTQLFNDAIRATDREIRGYIKLPKMNPDSQIETDKYVRGTDGLISFKVTSSAMDEERFCFGSVVSSYCEVSFFANKLEYVFSAGRAFEAYVGVGSEPTVIYSANRLSVTYGHGYINSEISADISAIEDGSWVRWEVNGIATETFWSSTNGVSVSDGTYTYSLEKNGSLWRFATDSQNGGGSTAAYYTVSLSTLVETEKCLGRFYVSEVTKDGGIETAIGYDVVNKLATKYVPTVTAGANGYEVIDILNDIVDQTGVNGGEHFTTTGSGIYIPAIIEATCKEQWGWLMTLCNDYGEIYTGSRTDLGYIEGRSYENGKNNYSNYPAIDNTVIYQDGIKEGDLFTVSSLTTGTDQHPIVIGSGVGINGVNPYIDSTHATTIYNNLNGISYRPMTIRFRGDPCIEVMDSLRVVSGDAPKGRCIVMKITSTYNGGFEQTIECWGDSEDYYDMSIGSIGATVNSIADYVIEEGKTSSPTWYYRKWKSGYYECMHRGIFTRSSWSASGSLYVASSGAGTQTYPVTFLAQPIEIVTAHADTPILLMCTDKQTTTVSGKYQFAVTSAPSGSQQIYVDYYVRGNV